MSAIFTKAAVLFTLAGRTTALTKRDLPDGESLAPATEEIKGFKMSALATGTSRGVDCKAKNSTECTDANAAAMKANRASLRPAADAGSLSANIKREKTALKTLSSSLESYKGLSDAAKGFAKAEAKAEKAKEMADKNIAEAMAEVQKAKKDRLAAAKLETKTVGLEGGLHPFGAADKSVAAAEKRLREAIKLGRPANAEVKKATSRADKAVKRAAQVEDKVDRARQDAAALAEAIKKGQAEYALREQKVASAEKDLQKTAKSTLSAMDQASKVREATKGGAAPRPAPKAK